MLIDAARPSASAEMVAELAADLRLPQGFADDAASLAMLARLMDAAVRIVEERTRRALIRRTMLLRVSAWDSAEALSVPVEPVAQVTELVLEHPDGARVMIDPAIWRLASGDGRSVIRARIGRRLPPIPRDGAAEAHLVAGYGAAWGDAPEDLRLAVVLLAASFFEQRAEAARSPAPLPMNVAALLEPYRRVRL